MKASEEYRGIYQISQMWIIVLPLFLSHDRFICINTKKSEGRRSKSSADNCFKYELHVDTCSINDRSLKWLYLEINSRLSLCLIRSGKKYWDHRLATSIERMSTKKKDRCQRLSSRDGAHRNDNRENHLKKCPVEKTPRQINPSIVVYQKDPASFHYLTPRNLGTLFRKNSKSISCPMIFFCTSFTI